MADKYTPIYKISLVKEGRQSLFEKSTISSPQNLVPIMRDYYKEKDREVVAVVMLNVKNKIIGINEASVGSLQESIIHPREVFKAAILANCSAIVLCHNHPSGDSSPSSEDIDVTKRILEAGKILGIPMLDHIIICEETHFSMKANGLI